ncbi:MAG: PhpK family radical SAM P-methyltransferase [Candidatus Aminicenantes bacterium]|nr:PhpK family radical SAM P-methyltransferase [Candidatus Aminicenantes bacterium]NIM83464.1 PhpK family radical SAM P-methyltransferase [Candidatus Aminicenantes bacterium]NIN22856.1 PhpK family radical SAM P-methyltransferase [Candidatus Aminicenantes bacterium]NIN46592.1 PhpK family radical SAM P-methyltransferase [Candidatus Aminicenantes bacterium]NIN89495.1 PhpK family radical SAM P-methyltransferase [Candidatus Aminicenantes bacterium]
MSRTMDLDCLLIGHNEMNFVEYEKRVREMGVRSGAYRDLDKNFIQYNHTPYHASEIFNIFYYDPVKPANSTKPLHIGENFSAAIAYLGTYLNRRGFTFDYVNSFQTEKELLAEKLARENILTIAVITTLYVSVFPILEVIAFIKKYNQTAAIIIGGPFVSNQITALDKIDIQYAFKQIGADIFVNSSQGEAALVKIIRALKTDSPIEKIENIYYRKDGKYVETPILKENNPISENMVNWDLFSRRAGEFVNVRTSISCPYSCSFCGFPQHAGTYQFAGVKEIEKELTLLNKIKTVKSVQFVDDTFNVPAKRFKEILMMMIKNKYTVPWHSHFRCQFADRETVELMKESGCEGVFLGIESGSNQILKNMNKAATVEKYLRGIELLKKYELLTYGSFIIGFPGETDETVQETAAFIKESGIDFFRAQLWYCDTTTPIWKEKEKYKIVGSHFEWSHDTMDSQKASDIIDEIFLSIDTPTWVPQYNFECDGLFHLLHRGLTLAQVKKFIKSFNQGIKEKLLNPSRREASFEVIKQIKASFRKANGAGESPGEKKNMMDNYNAEFDF